MLTSNRTRDVHDALEATLPLPLGRASRLRTRGRDRRACACPASTEPLARQVAAAVEALREARTCTSRPASPRPSTGRTALGRARRHRARRAHGRRHARHGAQVPRRPRTRPTSTASPTSSSRPSSGASSSLERRPGSTRTPRRADGRHVRPRPPRGVGCACRIGSVLTFVEALGRVGIARSRPASTGRGGRRSCATRRTSPCSTGPSPCSGITAQAQRRSTKTRRPCRSRSPSTTTATTTTTADVRRRSNDDRTIDAALLADRGAAPQGLRHVRRRRAPSAQQLMSRLRFVGPPRRSLPTSTGQRVAQPRPTCGRTRAHARCGPAASRSAATGSSPATPAPARAAARRQRLDGAVRPGAAAVRARRRGRPPDGSRRSRSAPA